MVCGWSNKHIFYGGVFSILFCSLNLAYAQRGLPDATSGEMIKISFPERNREGILVWQLLGDRAKLRPDGKMEIENIVVNTYRKSEVDWTLSTPTCILDRPAREAVSEADVHMYNKEIDITGKGFHWLANETRFIIRSRAHVVLSKAITTKENL
jgi:hypothetical protein